ncbi:MAG TPA: hypothetical protein VMV77_09705, partial [Bacteroidales bacterium]|nr:hypothetical protein [Bacteroidales bacterium]
MYILVLAAYGYFRQLKPINDLSPVISSKECIKSGLYLLLVSIFLYFVYLSSLLNFKTMVFTDTNCDWQFYAKISQYLNLGYESTAQFDNIAFNLSFTPYHYFEIWIAAIIS